MTWRFVLGLFVAFYEVMLGLFGVFGLQKDGIKKLFVIGCSKDNESVWLLNGLGDVFVTLHLIIIVI